jgi:hypothetical protein
MSKFHKILRKSVISIAIIGFTSITFNAIGQDTLAGDYNMLTIKAGLHIIKETVTVKGKLEIQAGAKIEFFEPGVLVCEGEVSIIGEKDNKIEFFGKSKEEGIGLVIRGVDNNNNSRVIINNSIFTGLQLPLYFDFGWKRASVNIQDNYFINNIGKVSVIQVLNPPFNLNIDASTIDFKLEHNLFSGNSASIYFEDLKSDHVKFSITNNTFYGNKIYGFKSYNISTNILYGRADEIYTRYTPFIENNSFAYNYLVDNIADTIVHTANFGIYGTEKTIGFKNNYLGAENKQDVLKSIYDRSINYNVPKVEFEPFLTKPNESNPTHIYAINNLDNSNIGDTLVIMEPLKGFILKANNGVDYTRGVLNFTYFKDDSSFKKTDTVLNYDVQPNGLTSKFTITSNVLAAKKNGFYNLTKITDKNGDYVPDVKFGFIAYSNELRRRIIIAETLKNTIVIDSIKKPLVPVDSVKNIFQKIETPIKSRFEVGLLTGSTVFLGTISKKGSILGNDMNMLLGVQVNYMLFSNISAGLNIESFKLSNSDVKSNNNEQLARGMSFSTSMLSISPSIHYDFVDNRVYSKAKKIKPSIGVGLDIVSFNPKGVYNGTVYNLQPLGTGGQYSDSTKKPYSTLALGYFFNFKVKYQINRFNSVGLHMSYHVSMSNYLDDVGPDPYPTIASLLKSKISNKDAAIYFSNPTAKNVVGQYRNSPDGASDSYLNFGIFYSRKLFK